MANIRRCNNTKCRHCDGTCCQDFDVEFSVFSTEYEGAVLRCFSFDPVEESGDPEDV